MAQYYENIIKTLEDVAKGSKTIPDTNDESLRLSLLEIYTHNEYKKLGNIIHLLSAVYLRKNKFKKNYSKIFDEAIIDLYSVYEQINKQYFNGENIEDFTEFYKDSINKYYQSN